MASSIDRVSFLKASLVALSAAFACAMPATDAEAARTNKIAHTKNRTVGKKPPPPPSSSLIGSSIVIDAVTGNELDCYKCDEQRPPASMIKVLTAMVVFDAIREGRLSKDERLPLAASPDEDRDEAFGLHRNYKFPVGTMFTADELIWATTITSAADATITLSLRLYGSDNGIAEAMNRKLDEIFPNGHVTNVANPHGMPDPSQRTTAREQALILKHMIDNYPEEYRYFGQDGYYIGTRYMKGHNKLLTEYNRRSLFDPYSCLMEGGKTGYFGAAGSNLVASAACQGHRVIAVRMGALGAATRNKEVAALFDKGFAKLAGTPVTVPGAIKAHKPGILRPDPPLEPEPDNTNQPQKISKIGLSPTPSLVAATPR